MATGIIAGLQASWSLRYTDAFPTLEALNDTRLDACQWATAECVRLAEAINADSRYKDLESAVSDVEDNAKNDREENDYRNTRRGF